MATLYIAELSDLAKANTGGPIQIAQMPPAVEQAIAFGAVSNAFSVNTRFLRLCADSACSIAIGANPTATTTNWRLAPNSVEYIGVTPGQKISVTSNS
jgi:hypothetical protein